VLFRVTGRSKGIISIGATLTKQTSFYIASSDVERSERDQREVQGLIAPTNEAASAIAGFFHSKTRELLKTKSYVLKGVEKRNVDVVQDVLKYVPLHWVMTEIVSSVL
jgi:linoleate 10R-lipoxygenase